MRAPLLLAFGAAALRCAAAAEAPWQLQQGDILVAEIPTGNPWQTRSYLLGDLAAREAAVRSAAVMRLTPGTAA